MAELLTTVTDNGSSFSALLLFSGRSDISSTTQYKGVAIFVCDENKAMPTRISTATRLRTSGRDLKEV